ncbi:MAG: hypothetical protein SFU53_13320 [Terrimicrobiaceae bacterium]|nr:hypothetical protein [Terrimicrobiaceae bacterium]
MKVPRLLILGALFSTIVLAGDPKPEDPSSLRKMATQLTQEAKHLEERLGDKASAKAKRFIEWTREEGELLQRSADALEKNQRRLADSFADKAKDFCSKRGPIAEEVHREAKAAEGEMKKAEGSATHIEKKWNELERRQAELDAEKRKLVEETADKLGE